ncbi:MAG: carboxypeptidase regulatory-like domain-containing protein, partial [Armatimonadetes bacterium]|nr:carboxypeptidase regulatory-like domain-containing protein [Armatimonadota bacterium]
MDCAVRMVGLQGSVDSVIGAVIREVGLILKRLKLVNVLLLMLVSAAFVFQSQSSALAQRSIKLIPATGSLNIFRNHQKPFIGPGVKILPSDTLRALRPGRAVQAPVQTINLTKSPLADDKDPFWTKDEQYIYFSSNRVSATNPAAGTLYHIYRINASDGSGLTQISGLSTYANDNQTSPAANTGENYLIWIDRGPSGVDIVLRNLVTGSDQSLLKSDNLAPAFTNYNHCEFLTATDVIFGGQVGAGTPYHLYSVNINTGVVTQWTTGAATDKDPTLDPTGTLIAFDSNRLASDGSTVNPDGHFDIWTMSINPASSNFTRMTNFEVGGVYASNIDPAWSTNKVDSGTGPNGLPLVNGRQLIAFSSTRYDSTGNGHADAVGTTYHIYWMPAIPEGPTNQPLKLNTNDPNNRYNDLHPTWPQFINTYRIAFQSDRTDTDFRFPPTSPPGSPQDLFSSTIVDLHAPTLVAYNTLTDEIVHVDPRQAAPGSTVTFTVKVADFETGVNSVYIQIKNPNSKYQQSSGVEHKDYLSFFLSPDGTNGVFWPVEYDCDRIYANSGPLQYTYNKPAYIASIDDYYAFSGSISAPRPSWLKLTQTGTDADGNEIWSGSWVTPSQPSDYYIDVIAYDNAVDPFNPTDKQNWKIYDNIWGFSTKPFVASKGILFVSDYSAGQKFFATKFGINSLNNVGFTFWGTESWLTDFNVSLLPTTYYPPNNGTPGPVDQSQVLNTLGVHSYTDSLNLDGNVVDGWPDPASQQYNIWRIQCRGPIPDSVLDQYLPHTEQQPADTIDGQTTPRNVLVAPRCVIWNAPYAGDLWTGPGTIADLSVQAQLAAFIAAGGRIFVNGQDIGWALTQNGTFANSFFTNDLRATYIADLDPGLVWWITGPEVAATNILGQNALAAQGAPDPISHDPWDGTYNALGHSDAQFHNYYNYGNNPSTYDPPNLVPPIFVAGTDPLHPRTMGAFDAMFPDHVGVTNGSILDISYGGESTQAALLHWSDPTTGAEVVYCPAGFEAFNSDAYTEYHTGSGSAPMAFRNKRAEIMHNIICWLRTGTVYGTIRNSNGNTPIAGALIRVWNSYDTNGNPIIVGTGRTDANGNYSIDGLPPSPYLIQAFEPGFTFQHGIWFKVHGATRTEISSLMTAAPPASLTGKVTLTDGTTPIAGAVVTATDNSDPTGNTKVTATTGTDGTYTIAQLPSQTTYTLSVSDPNYGAAIAVNSGVTPLGSTYPVPNPNDPNQAQRDTVVQSGKSYTGFDFELKPIPGSLAGVVSDKNTSVGISGATVTATFGSETQTATTSSNGSYSFSALDPGTWSLVATAAGYTPNSPAVTASVVSNQTTTGINIQLLPSPPGSLSGLVTRSNDNSPLSGVTITIVSGSVQQTTVTGPVQTSGGYQYNYKFSGVPSNSTFTITATLSGFTAVPASQSASVTPGTETQNINFAMNPLHTFPGPLTLVSAPYDYSGTDVAQLLGIQNISRFYFVGWENNQYIYYPTAPANVLHLGTGYFLSYQSNIALSVQGSAAPTNQVYSLPVKPGWNLIGDPFPFSIDWLKVQILYNGQTLSLLDAQTQGLIGAALWTYQSGQYQLAFTLEPWIGDWVQAFQPVTILIDPVNDRINRSVPQPTTRAELVAPSTGWDLNINVTSTP